MDDLSNVYDLICPSPPPLMELASMEIAISLWRREIQQNLTEEGTLRERYPRKKTSLPRVMEDLGLPSKFLPIIERYVVKLSTSIPKWLYIHQEEEIFEPEFHVLKYFTDFVCDFDGGIHYRKTAKRFVTCEKIDNDVKFRMACFYCLVDDILRIWPKVSSRWSMKKSDYSTYSSSFPYNPYMKYWVYRLTYHSKKVRVLLRKDIPFIEELFEEEWAYCSIYNWPAREYFLNHLPSDKAMKYMFLFADLLYDILSVPRNHYKDVFVRHMLVKLNETELRKLLHERARELISSSNPSYVLNVWTYIKNKMTNDDFCRVVEYMLKDESQNLSLKDDRFYWRELWNSAPDHFKNAAIRNVLPNVDSSYFSRSSKKYVVGARRRVSFLSAILSDIPIDDRRKFWNKHGRTIFIDIRPRDLHMLVNLCFGHYNNLTSQFKEDVLSKNHRKIYRQLKKLLGEGFLEELEEFLTFWYVNEQTIKEIRLKLLHDNLTISTELLCKASLLNQFIDSAYEDENLATEFKNTLLVIPEMNAIETIKIFLTRGRDFHHISEFFDTFAPSAKMAKKIKRRDIVPAFTLKSINPDDLCFINFEEFKNFIGWLFRSASKIEKFKLSLDVDEIIEKWVKDKVSSIDYTTDWDWFKNSFQTSNMPDSFVKKFLKWYFVSRDAIKTFKNDNYAHDPLRYKMLKRLLI